jgi:hypothetical protein
VEIEQHMADPGFYKNREHAREIASEYKEVQKKLPVNYFQWNALMKDLEALNATDHFPGSGEGRTLDETR